MSWLNKTGNGVGYKQETFDLSVAGNGQGFGSVINFIKLKFNQATQYVTFAFDITTITGTNVDVAIYGAFKAGGTKFLLTDAIVADLKSSDLACTLNMLAIPAPVYYLSFIGDNAETGNSIVVRVYGDLGSEGILSDVNRNN